MKEKSFRENLLEFLFKGPAHLSVEDGLKEISPENRHKRIQNSPKTIWEEFEHMRLAQEDILRYTLDPSWNSPPWPEGYWPEKQRQLTEEMWAETSRSFFEDLYDIGNLIKDETLDLTDRIPHGEGRTYLREILLVIDHNSYHLGKIIHMRRLLGDLPT